MTVFYMIYMAPRDSPATKLSIGQWYTLKGGASVYEECYAVGETLPFIDISQLTTLNTNTDNVFHPNLSAIW